MFTLQGLQMRTAYMMEAIRQNVIEETMKQFKAAAHHYYSVGYDSGELVKAIKDLEGLGVDMDEIIDIEFSIREQYK